MSRLFSRLTAGTGMLALLLALSLGALFGPARGAVARSVTARSLAANAHTLVVARTLDDMRTMDPDRMYEFSSEAAGINIFDPLVTFHGTNMSRAIPDLATSWKITRGGRVYTFSLRHDVTFSTGRRMTAADVVFTYRRLGYLNDNPAFLMGATAVGKKVTIYGIKALNKYTVQFTLSAPDYSFLAQVSDVNFGVLDRVAAMAHGAVDTPNAATLDRATTWLNEHSISTGPFMLQSWVRGAAGSITLIRNPHYWRKPPFLSKIVFQGVESPATQRLEVQRGTVDMAQSVDADGVKALKGNPNVKIVSDNSLDLIYMGMTLNPSISKPLSKPLVRQAIRHAINYSGIIHGLLDGLGAQTNGMIPLGLVGNLPPTNNKLKPTYDPTMAKNLLKQAGYPHGFSVDLYYGVGHVVDGVSMDLIMPYVQQNLRAVGINATLKPEDFTVMLAAYRAQKLPMVAIEWGVDYPDSGDFAGPFSPGGGPAKRMWWTGGDAHLASLVAAGTATGNLVKRSGIYRQIENIWLKESPFAPIVQPPNIIVLHKGVSGYVISPLYVQGNVRNVRKS